MKRILLVLFGLLAVSGTSALFAQQNGYMQTNLTANTAGVANNTDSQLSNPWGISFVPGQPFWIANNNGGTSTLYDANGVKQSLVVGIPSASTNPCNPGCPTGTVANSTAGYFNNGTFIFDTEDGIIANWTGASNAVIAVDNSANGAVYKGLALLNNSTLLAANFNSGKIDVFDHNFQPTTLSGTFTDPNLPAGYAPHGIHIIGSQIFVAYGVQDGAKHDPVVGAGNGQVDIFDLNGNFVSVFAAGGKLNAPWGIVQASASFGQFSNDILVGNFGDGTINAFDTTGKFLGQFTDSGGNVIVNAGLWDMVFGAGGTGDPNTLYFTAGGSSQTSGLFATLTPASSATNPNFSLALSSQTTTLASGGSANITVNVAGTGGFNGSVMLSCSTASGLTCKFSPSSISPGSSTASSTLTVSAAPAPPQGGYIALRAGLLPLSSLGLFGLTLTSRRKKTTRVGKYVKWLGTLSLIIAAFLFTVACGGSSSSGHTGTTSSQVTLMVTGTSGSISHTAPVTVTIN